jgi:hypothetical protein
MNYVCQDNPLSSKLILVSNLQQGGFDAQLVNLRDGTYEEEYGTVTWGGINLTKSYVGQRIWEVDPQAYDAWGVTNNFLQYREVAFMVIRYLSSAGKPVVVGGSDAIASPHLYLQAGASAVVTDKSGGANWAIFDHVLGQPMREPLSGVILADGSQYPLRKPPLSPEDWPLPSLDLVKQCLGKNFWAPEKERPILPMGSIMADLGCDRKCSFCQTPTYGTGYRRMSPKRTLQWYELQTEAGAKSVVSHSDQFLGRVLFKEGRQEILDITRGIREMGQAVIWGNGLELKKATLGRGYDRKSDDLKPDEELVNALWGWDGKVGCYQAFIPAERPFLGRKSYAKLLPWQQHIEMLRTIVRAGVPRILYGVVIGLPDDSNETMLFLEEALAELYQDLKRINPLLELWIEPSVICPIPGTPQSQTITQSGLLRFEDPVIRGSFELGSADTHHLSYVEVYQWRNRLRNVANTFSMNHVEQSA